MLNNIKNSLLAGILGGVALAGTASAQERFTSLRLV